MLSTAVFADLIESLQPGRSLAVAVSGGSDSLALARLCHDWAQSQNRRIIGLTVDHGLRQDSADEAAQVGRWLAQWGMEHHCQTWSGPKPAGGIQAAARQARYGLMEAFCLRHGIDDLLLGHTADDQAETIYLRLMKKSGLDGLAGMARLAPPLTTNGPGPRRLRPLLSCGRADLQDYLVGLGQSWISDPSNDNMAFERIIARRRIAAAGEGPLGRVALLDLAQGAARLRQDLVAETDRAIARLVIVYDAGYGRIDGAGFARLPREIGLRVLSRLVRAIGGASSYGPRSERLERLLNQMYAGEPSGQTLGHCRLVPKQGGWIICRERRNLPPAQSVGPGEKIIWDGRFRLSFGPALPSNAWVAAFDPRFLSPERPGLQFHKGVFPVPGVVLPSLPALYDDEGILAVPHLRYNRPELKRLPYEVCAVKSIAATALTTHVGSLV